MRRFSPRKRSIRSKSEENSYAHSELHRLNKKGLKESTRSNSQRRRDRGRRRNAQGLKLKRKREGASRR